MRGLSVLGLGVFLYGRRLGFPQPGDQFHLLAEEVSLKTDDRTREQSNQYANPEHLGSPFSLPVQFEAGSSE